jgi:hypothetical protein
LTDEEKAQQQQFLSLFEVDRIALRTEKEKSFARWLFHKLFHTEVLYLSTLKSLWEDRLAPQPLALESQRDELKDVFWNVSASYQPQQNVWCRTFSPPIFFLSRING